MFKSSNVPMFKSNVQVQCSSPIIKSNVQVVQCLSLVGNVIVPLPFFFRHIWKRVVEKAGEPSIETFDRIFDNKSLESLLSNAVTKAIVDNILVSEGGPKLNIGTSIRKKYWVFLKKGKLTTLSRDFMDGVGSEYLWTEDSSLHPPSTQWRLATKREKDPRRRHIDPRTTALWVPDDERIPVVANPEKQNDDSSSDSSSSSSSSSSDSSDSSDDSSSDESDDDAGHDEKVVKRDAAKNEEKAVDCNDDNDANNVPEDKNDIDESGGADDDNAGDEVVERDDGGNVSDLGDVVGVGVDSVGAGNVSDLGDVVGVGVDSIGVDDDVSSSRVDLDNAGLVGTKRAVEEYGNTSSDDSDSDDEKKNVPAKIARVL